MTALAGAGNSAPCEEAVADNPDATFMADELQAEGRSRESALHAMYAQVVGQRLFADVRQLPRRSACAPCRAQGTRPPARIEVLDATPEQVAA